MARINMVGAGIVGQATGKGFLAHGHDVQFIDINPNIIQRLRDQGLRATFPEDVDWSAADMTMVAVNTPTVNGRIVLSHFLKAVETLATGLAGSTAYHIVVVRSTVPPTTTTKIVKPMIETLSGRFVGHDLGLCMNPEFLRQVSAEQDFLKPWLTVIGSSTPVEMEVMGEFYASFNAPIVHTDCTTAEVIKYANNLYNATKISFFNEFYLLCERLGIDSDVVGRTISLSAEGMWNPAYGTRGGWPYGGACLPKDTAALYDFARGLGHHMPLLAAVMRVNALMEERVAAPASMQEVVSVDELASAGLATAAHAASVATSGAIEGSELPLDFSVPVPPLEFEFGLEPRSSVAD